MKIYAMYWEGGYSFEVLRKKVSFCLNENELKDDNPDSHGPILLKYRI